MDYNLNKPIAKRKTKTVYVDNDKIIKLFSEDYSKTDILNEALNHARVEESTDLNVPKLEEVKKIDNKWGVVLQYIDGTPLDVLMKENQEREDEYLNMFIDIQFEVFSKNVPMLNKIKDKFKRKLINADNIDENIKYELMHRLEGMKEHTKLCHGDFNPSNIIIKKDGSYSILDWAHATQGNASADAARTFLIFSMQGESRLADKYLDLFCKKSGIEKNNIQRWIPIVAATQLTKGNKDEEEFLRNWIDIVDYQ